MKDSHDTIVSDSSKNKEHGMSPGDPLDLLRGISDLFVSYEPNFGFENTLEFSSSPRSKLISAH